MSSVNLKYLPCWWLGTLAAVMAFAQPGTITTYAGGYPDGIPGPAKPAVLQQPGPMAQDSAGNIYIMGFRYQLGASLIYKLTPDRPRSDGPSCGDEFRPVERGRRAGTGRSSPRPCACACGSGGERGPA